MRCCIFGSCVAKSFWYPLFRVAKKVRCKTVEKPCMRKEVDSNLLKYKNYFQDLKTGDALHCS